MIGAQGGTHHPPLEGYHHTTTTLHAWCPLPHSAASRVRARVATLPPCQPSLVTHHYPCALLPTCVEGRHPSTRPTHREGVAKRVPLCPPLPTGRTQATLPENHEHGTDGIGSLTGYEGSIA